MKLALVLLLLPALSQAKICGKISSRKGAVEVLRFKTQGATSGIRQAFKAKKRMKLWCTDIIATHEASRAKLRLDKAILTMGPNSRLEIAAETKGGAQDLSLPYGKVRTLFKGKARAGQAARFKVKTPAAVVGVRGTDFYVTYKPNEKISEQATISGKVEVIQKETGKIVEVKPGEQVKVDNFKAKLNEKIASEQRKLVRQKRAEQNIDQLSGEDRKRALQKIRQEARVEAIAKKPQVAEEMKAQILAVEKIDDTVKSEIRQTSVIVKNDEEFTSKEAVKILGDPDRWDPAKNEEIPDKFKDIENEF